jgi:hypothetical protein
MVSRDNTAASRKLLQRRRGVRKENREREHPSTKLASSREAPSTKLQTIEALFGHRLSRINYAPEGGRAHQCHLKVRLFSSGTELRLDFFKFAKILL